MNESKYLSESQLQTIAAQLNDWMSTGSVEPEKPLLGTSLLPIVDAVVSFAEPMIEPKVVLTIDEPFLGLATTMQLVDELRARCQVSETNGESWPTDTSTSGPLSTLDSTKKLIDELVYRVHVADGILGQKWPSYRTVDGRFSIEVKTDG